MRSKVLMMGACGVLASVGMGADVACAQTWAPNAFDTPADNAVARLIDTVQRAQSAFLAVLEGHTIADIVANQSELRRVLGLDVDRAA